MKKVFTNVFFSIIRKLLSSTPFKDDRYISELRTDFRALSTFEIEKKSDTDAAWQKNMNQIKELVLTRDPRKFLTWDVINKTMFVSYGRYIRKELKHLKSNNWEKRWKSAIKENSVGTPTPYLFYRDSSCNLIHHAYHVAQFEEKSGVNVNDIDLVFEFGGGYGSMYRLFNNLGFRGKYIIFDLPPFSALQKYYLKNLDLTVLSVDDFHSKESGVLCISDIYQLADLLNACNKEKNNLFLATWSLSESPLELREDITRLLDNFNLYLIAYQHRFRNIDNLIFFNKWQMEKKFISWLTWEIDHMPLNNYLIGYTSLK